MLYLVDEKLETQKDEMQVREGTTTVYINLGT